MTPRDPYERVRAFLTDAQVRPDFTARAFARIEGQHDELGDSFLWTPLGLLVAEGAQEAEDLAAWSALIAARISTDASDATADARARALLTMATQRAAEADAALCELRRLIERAA